MKLQRFLYPMLAAGFITQTHAAQQIVPSALLTIDQNRPTVIDRIVGEWGDRLASSSAGISPAQLREILGGLRADALLAASLAGSLDGLRDVVATAITSTAPPKPGRLMPMALGDSNADLAYTPITPCRILDTRNGTAPPYNSVLVGGAAVQVAANLANFASQGGSATNCNLPSSFQAIAVTFTVLNPNFDAFLAASNTSNFATLTQSVVMDFSANRGLANTGIVPVDSNVKFYLGLPAQVTTHVIADAVGVLRRPGNYGGTHVITGIFATDSGGQENTASGNVSTVGGGYNNTASGAFSTVAGGLNNTANFYGSGVVGGNGNTASGQYAAVGGGSLNIASGNSSAVPGGYSNVASGSVSLAAGQSARATHDYSFLWCDGHTICNTQEDRDFIVVASGGIKLYNDVAGCLLSSGQMTWACASDRNLKENFSRIDTRDVLRRVSAMPITRWNVKGYPRIQHVGPVAQDFYAAFSLGNDDLHIELGDVSGVALAAIQGLDQLMQQKDREIAQLKRKLDSIEAKMDR